MNTKPPQSKILARQTGSAPATEWDIPAKRGVGFLMIFGCIFGVLPLFMLTFFTLIHFFGIGQTNVQSRWEITAMVAFMSIFFLIGATAFYFGLKSRYTSYQVKLRHGGVSVLKKFLKKETAEKLAGGNVYGVGLYSGSETNGKPNYGLLVKARKGRDIELLYNHSENELRWLASEMLARLVQQGGLPTEEEIAKVHSDSHDQENAGTLNGVRHFKKQGVTITQLESGNEDQFVIEKNGSVTGRTKLLGSLLGLIFSSIFIWIGFFSEDSDIIFGLAGLFAAVSSFVSFVLGVFQLGTSEKYTFKTDTLVKEKLRGGVSKSKTVIQKSSLARVEAKSSGNSNGNDHYTIKLTTKGNEKPIKVFKRSDADVKKAVKYKINEWLKPHSITPTETSLSNGYGSSFAVEKTSVQPSTLPSEVPIYTTTLDLKDLKGGIWVLRIFLTLFLALGLGLTIFGALNIITAKQSKTWPSEQGVILTSKITVDRDSDGTTYGTAVSYRYEVEGKSYEGDKVTISEISTNSRGRANKIVKRYPKGKEIAVFYDPENPEKSVLETGFSVGNWLFLGVGLMLFIIPLIILINIEKERRKEPKANKNTLEDPSKPLR